MKKYAFGIDVGGTTVKCAFFKTDGEMLEKWEIVTRTEDNGKNILPDCAGTILEKLEEHGVSADDVEGIGIAVPGPVNDDGEASVAVNIHWGRVHVRKEMEKLTGIRTMATNDANAAALGEMWKGGAAGCSNIILVTIGTGIGGGVVVNGRVIAGAHGAGGEIGHSHVDDTITEQCNCGNYGCLEQVTAAGGIVRLAKQELAKTDEPSSLRGADLDAKIVFDAVKDGDPVAKRVAVRFGDYMGRALAMFACMSDPEVIVIGGGVSRAGQVLLDHIEGPFYKYVFPPVRKAKFALAKLGNDAGVYGAVRLLL